MLNAIQITELKNELETSFPKSVALEGEPMSKHTTFRIGGNADIYMEPAISEVAEIINFLNKKQVPFCVIGNGSNLLVSDKGVEGVVISLGKPASEIEVCGNTITAQAGALLSSVANTALKAGLGGMEFAAGIPGSIGGAVYMNAGAYGGEIKDILVSATVLTKENKVEEWPVSKLDLSYRHSLLMKESAYVLSAKIQLTPKPEAEIKAVMDDLKEKRISKQPLNYPSAGSTFKRPEGYFAGKLIDDAGLRGFSVGDAQVSEKHCGFVINKGGATCSQVQELMAAVDNKVFELFKVHLEPEVRFLGRK